MRYLLLVIAAALLCPSQAPWVPFTPMPGWMVNSVELTVGGTNYRLSFELAMPQADLDNHNYVLWVMFNPSDGDSTTLDPTIRRVISFSTNVHGAFPQNWGIQGFKIVNLYAQRSPQTINVRPNDPWDLNHNPVMDVITLCQGDPQCKAIVAAWGTILINPTRLVIARKNLIAGHINTVHTQVGNDEKGGYIGTLTAPPRRSPRHPLYVDSAAEFGPPDYLIGHWRDIPAITRQYFSGPIGGIDSIMARYPRDIPEVEPLNVGLNNAMRDNATRYD